MKSRTTRQFWIQIENLPVPQQDLARKAYSLWRTAPTYPSLHFKRVSRIQPVYSIRIGIHYRALGRLDDDTVTWFWIGHHDEYERLLKG